MTGIAGIIPEFPIPLSGIPLFHFYSSSPAVMAFEPELLVDAVTLGISPGVLHHLALA